MDISATDTENWADLIVGRLTAIPAIPHDLVTQGYVFAGLIAFLVLVLTYVGIYYLGRRAGFRSGLRSKPTVVEVERPVTGG
jgi:hypothetical protein